MMTNEKCKKEREELQELETINKTIDLMKLYYGVIVARFGFLSYLPYLLFFHLLVIITIYIWDA